MRDEHCSQSVINKKKLDYTRSRLTFNNEAHVDDFLSMLLKNKQSDFLCSRWEDF